MKLMKTSAAFAAIVAVAGLLGAPAKADTVLRLNNWLPPGHSQLVGVMKPWMENVAKATDGRVKVELTGASLGAPKRQYDLAVDGIADVTFGVHGYTPGRFKLPGVAELPFMAEKGEALSVALWHTYEAFFKEADEYKDVVLLATWAHGSGRILTSGSAGPVNSAETYKGKKLRVGGGIVQKINPALGAVNVAASANEVYELLSQGVVDGTLLPVEAYPSFKLSGVIKYVTEIPGGFYSSVWFAVMNKDAFAKLSAEDQKAVMSVSGVELARLGGRAFDTADDAARKIMTADGVETITADDAFIAFIKDKTSSLEGEWVAIADGMNIDGKAAVAKMRSEATAYKVAK
ncbi:MAG: TRAP transporter substrate-binding protein [Rhizobiaceae bacterium]|nr:TRAP transporter substrate-binding protein [Rhizobiaceae bacterium]MBL4732073.1 TRAP transporter substrate-binding protein [Rhizobiaceae bacterium]